MDYSKAADALMRRKIVEEIYRRMTDEEKRLFLQMSMTNRSHNEVMLALQQQQKQLEDLRRRQQTFGEDFLSNVAGNAVFEGVVWLASRLFRRLC